MWDLDNAEALAREALDIDYRRGDDMSIPWKVNGLAAVATDRREFDRAATLMGIADATMGAFRWSLAAGRTGTLRTHFGDTNRGDGGHGV